MRSLGKLDGLKARQFILPGWMLSIFPCHTRHLDAISSHQFFFSVLSTVKGNALVQTSLVLF